ncbi:hypothetical protein HMPREF9016_00817 [Neisseria sp. oral taxon 014 str. F0314]|uniref:DciA family protein n=1 Tax=Neisseria sp. oral taxon 014 TaxID=641148 RepID=UPI0001D8C0EE|nr:DciA family protein [Neisseria sp. oral taxon 014]EFI24637.1 hypothetical protein HMPREF9016_00817 [Neisseria sp. oral taxon 014 str. F0314]
MNLEQLGKRDRQLESLLRQSQQWRKLDGEVKRIMPANLRPHFQTACVEGGRLVLLAANSMAASRLKMILPALLPQLRKFKEDIEAVAVKTVPKIPEREKVNSLHLSETALESLGKTADRVRERHPELADVLERLAEKHKVK